LVGVRVNADRLEVRQIAGLALPAGLLLPDISEKKAKTYAGYGGWGAIVYAACRWKEKEDARIAELT
jgi:hypothetical protein